jgi:hypothetical protein
VPGTGPESEEGDSLGLAVGGGLERRGDASSRAIRPDGCVLSLLLGSRKTKRRTVSPPKAECFSRSRRRLEATTSIVQLAPPSVPVRMVQTSGPD